MRHHERLYQDLVVALEARFPGLRIMKKGDSPFCRFIDKVLKVLTFGGQRKFLTGYVTTFGKRIYVPDDWDTHTAGHRYCVLRHEAVHVKQFRKLTFAGMTLVYVLLPLPVLLAGGRAWLEWQGYRETLVANWQIWGRERARASWLRNEIVGRFTGPDYAWMWVIGSHVRKAIDRELARLDDFPPEPLKVPD